MHSGETDGNCTDGGFRVNTFDGGNHNAYFGNSGGSVDFFSGHWVKDG